MLMACGYGHTLVIVGSGEARKVLACGRGNTGQLGNGDRESKGVFSEIQGPISNKRVISVAAGLAHSLALTEFGCVFVWGAGTWGQLGVGSTKMATTPQVVKGKLEGRRVKAISAGQCHSLALSEDQVFAWGGGGFGQIGHGIVEDALWPVPVGGFLVGRRVQAIAAGGEHSLALTQGRIIAWGSSSCGQLGTGQLGGRQLTPVDVGEVVRERVVYRGIAAGGCHSLAVTSKGRVFAWGRGTSGQLGLGSWACCDVARPTEIEGELLGKNVKQVSAGSEHSAVLTDCGQVFTWGAGGSGQLGHGGESSLSSPRQVAQVSASLVASGGQHTGVITAEGKVMTWGCGSDGRLGLGTNSSFLGANSSEPNGRSAKSRDNKSQPNRSLPEEVRGVRVQRLRVERCEEEAVLGANSCAPPRVAGIAEATAAAERERAHRWLHWKRPPPPLSVTLTPHHNLHHRRP